PRSTNYNDGECRLVPLLFWSDSMRTFAKVLCGAVALVVLAQPVAAQDAVLLRYKMEKGKEYIYRKEALVKQKQTINNKMKIDTDIASKELGVWKLEGADDKGNLEIKTQNKELAVTMKIPTVGEYNFDSKKKDNDKGGMLGAALTPLYERVTGATLTL